MYTLDFKIPTTLGVNLSLPSDKRTRAWGNVSCLASVHIYLFSLLLITAPLFPFQELPLLCFLGMCFR